MGKNTPQRKQFIMDNLISDNETSKELSSIVQHIGEDHD